jgi:nucleotide-binding universal stress UspA family protein
MTTTTVHQCFRCELRFATEAELEDHLVVDHDVDLRHPTTPAPAVEPSHGMVTVFSSPVLASGPGADVAMAVARQAGMALELVTVDEPGVTHATVDRRLHAGRQHVLAGGVPHVRTLRLDRDDEGTASAILRHLLQHPPVLAAMLTRRRTAAGDLVLGSVSRPVVVQSPVPVLLAHPGLVAAARYERVIVGVDGSDVAEHAVTRAADLAGRLGAGLWIVQVTDPEMLPNEVPESGYVHRLAEQVSTDGLEVSFEVLHGPVRRSLVRFGEQEPGTILVVGASGASGSRIGSLGSVSRDVVRRAACPVVVVGSHLAG